MTADFSGVVPELALVLDRSAAVPLGEQVQEALRTAIRAGRLRSGEPLPSTRQLADQLSISRGLVVTAYEQLLAEGHVVSGVGSDPGVAEGMNGEAAPLAPGPAEEPPADPGPATRLDFGYGVPDLRAYP